MSCRLPNVAGLPCSRVNSMARVAPVLTQRIAVRMSWRTYSIKSHVALWMRRLCSRSGFLACRMPRHRRLARCTLRRHCRYVRILRHGTPELCGWPVCMCVSLPCACVHSRLTDVPVYVSAWLCYGDPQQQQQQGGWVHPDNVPQGDYLKQFGTDLSAMAERRELDPVLGRHDEIRRTIQILCRRTKNNPVLIGEPGVGKTAIAEGLAQRIFNGEVPESMKSKRVIVLDMAALVAGASAQGQFEERLKGVLRDVENSNGQVLLFIDEMHVLMSTGGAGPGAANMLKPALARGKLHCIGATTLKEYKQYIEKDAALARRFQEVYVAEPNVEDTITILRGLRERYEVHHGVQITDASLVAAAQLSAKYMTGRRMPDKAVDLVDEAASRLRLQQDSKPERIWKLEKVISTKRIEIAALKLEKDKESAQRLAVRLPSALTPSAASGRCASLGDCVLCAWVAACVWALHRCWRRTLPRCRRRWMASWGSGTRRRRR